jgi:hypothetical protein
VALVFRGDHGARLVLWPVNGRGIRVALGIVRVCRVCKAGGMLSKGGGLWRLGLIVRRTDAKDLRRARR